jgi:predicted dehydrogenase
MSSVQPSALVSSVAPALPGRPQLAFIGVGWIGRHRLRALVRADIAEVAAICDQNSEARRTAAVAAPQAPHLQSIDELAMHDVDGVVIATPSALHFTQALSALEQGRAVFCQKPLARTAAETRRIVEAARRADLPLGVDFCYRHIAGAEQMRQLVQSGELGEIFCVDLTFHNAYGPDKSWFYDPRLSGGGCVIDLGIHLADLAGWITGEWGFEDVRSTLWRNGSVMEALEDSVEDCAIAEWRQPAGAAVRLACSWNLSAGQDAVIEAKFFGTRGAVVLRNLNGSFFRFVCEHHVGTQRHVLEPSPPAAVDNGTPHVGAPAGADSLTVDSSSDVDSAGDGAGSCDTWDTWGGAALIDWTRRLAEGRGFDDQVEHFVTVAELLDAVYGRQPASQTSRSSSRPDRNGLHGSREPHASSARNVETQDWLA